MNQNMEIKKSRLNDNAIVRMLIVLMVLFVGLTPLAISLLPGLPLLEQLWVAFAVSAITTLSVVLMLGIISELAMRLHRFGYECFRAIRGDRDRGQNRDRNALPTAG